MPQINGKSVKESDAINEFNYIKRKDTPGGVSFYGLSGVEYGSTALRYVRYGLANDLFAYFAALTNDVETACGVVYAYALKVEVFSGCVAVDDNVFNT